MTRPSLKQIETLFQEIILPFHQIKRDLTLPIDDHRSDNDAEHSWSLALLACALAPEIDAQLDTGKVCMLAIAHDVVEVYAGDTSVWASKEQLASKAVREHQALKKIRQKFTQFSWLASIIEEYELKQTPESQFVWSLDKFLNLYMLYLDKGYYYSTKYKLTKQQVDNQLTEHRQKAHAHPQVAEYYEQVRAAFDAHPEYFYQGESK